MSPYHKVYPLVGQDSLPKNESYHDAQILLSSFLLSTVSSVITAWWVIGSSC